MSQLVAAISALDLNENTPIGLHRVQTSRSANPADFSQKIRINFNRSHYSVKSAENLEELLQAITLRQEVFRQEFCADINGSNDDFDELDMAADHLLVVHNASQRVVGNYRLISSRYSNRFYSQGEFFLSEFLGSNGGKLELSRSCVRPEYRCGIVMQLLWRGVIEYMQATKARYLFGCTSVKTVRHESISRLAALLDKQNAFTDRYEVAPLPHCRVHESAELGRDLPDTGSVSELMPPIMKAYLRAGAKLCRQPAIDLEFQCTDFLTILDLNAMRDDYARKYIG